MSERNPSSSAASPTGTSISRRDDTPRARRWSWVVGAGVVVVLIVVVLVVSGGGDGELSQGPTGQVQKGPFIVSVTEAGEVYAEKRTVISNELRWPVVIKTVVLEGSVVKKGEKIIEFECRELIESITRQEVTVTSARNDYIQARENKKLKEQEMANRVRKAEQALKDANEDLIRYHESDQPIQLKGFVSGVDMLNSELALAQGKLDFKVRVNENPDLKSPYSDTEIKADRLKVDDLKNQLEKAELEKDRFLRYDDPRKRMELSFKAEDAKLDLMRANLEKKTELLVAAATEQAKEATLKMQETRLEEYREDEGKLIVTAEKEGLVVHDTGGSRRHPSDVTVEVGEEIRSRQQLMIIPDMTSLVIKTKIYEAISEIAMEGVEAFIRLDARPDTVFKGRVKKISVLPNREDWWRPGVKVFDVLVEFTEPVEKLKLKPGTTAEVELILARLDSVLYVPVAAVFTEQERRFCYVVSGSEVTMAPVKVGRMNDENVEIISGLSEGQVVLLQSPEADWVSETQLVLPGEQSEEGERR